MSNPDDLIAYLAGRLARLRTKHAPVEKMARKFGSNSEASFSYIDNGKLVSNENSAADITNHKADPLRILSSKFLLAPANQGLQPFIFD